MPAAINPGLDNTNLERIFPEWVKQNKEMQVLTCFNKMSRESTKNFPHTKRVGHYLVGKMINKGSFAKVMEGLHIPTGQKVAMKVICKKKAKQDSYVLKNMKREPRIHQMIKHPNIVQLYETLETENSYYMVMELCLGGDLMDRICEKKKLEERDVRKYTRQLMSAVEHLHRHGIVHRDLKIENFLLDENNNIKIVDFGLSNTIRFEGLSQELLNTQCGSPAYAAPELLANKKYGPKVDVWSIGVSMFAMLTGTLPFTVEPFNIKQLHQKMIKGEISPIPPDISAGAVQFIHSLLEPDPSRRPTVKEAMEDKWLNEGFTQKPLNSVSYKNRLRPDELSTLVLNYMTETMDLDISEIINTLVNNRPSPIMASYCLILKKLQTHQKEHRILKKNEPGEWNAPSAKQWIENEISPEKLLVQHEAEVQNKNNDHSIPSKDETQNTVQCENEKKDAKRDKRQISHEPIQEDEIAITLDNQENGFEGSKFAGREMVFLELPNSSKQEALDANMKHSSLDIKKVNDLKSNHKNTNPDKKSEYFSSKPQKSVTHGQPPQSCKMGSSHTRKTEVKPFNRLLCESTPSKKQFTQFRDLLKSVDNNIPPAYGQQQDKDCLNIVMIETLHHSLLPRVRQPTLREPVTKRISWVASHHIKTGSPPFVVNGSRPPVFPIPRQQTFMVRHLRNLKEKPHVPLDISKIKRNTVQLKQTHKSTDLNLPLLLPIQQKKSDQKNDILRLEVV